MPRWSPTRTRVEKASATYRLPVWLIRAVKFDAARQGVDYSRVAESILSRGVSPESRRNAQDPEPAATPAAQ